MDYLKAAMTAATMACKMAARLDSTTAASTEDRSAKNSVHLSAASKDFQMAGSLADDSELTTAAR